MQLYTPEPSVPPAPVVANSNDEAPRLDFAHGHLNLVVDLPPRLLARQVRVTVAGGSYRNALLVPEDWYGVSLAAELLPVDGHDHVPCGDFRVPEVREVVPALRRALREAVINGRPVFAGCMGGTGRTGLFLAMVISVLCPEEDPIKAVRRLYKKGAVETPEQVRFVRAFHESYTAPPLRDEVRRWARWARYSRTLARLRFVTLRHLWVDKPVIPG